MTGDRDKQHLYEESNDVVAAAKRLDELRKGAAEGNLDLPKASRLIANTYVMVQDALEAEMAIKTRGTGGKLKNWLRAIPTTLAAVIALRECIAILSRSGDGVNIQTLASTIGRLWELEVKIKEAESVNPMYMKKVHEQIKDRCTTDQTHIRRVYNTAYENIMKGELDSSLNQAEYVQLGKYGVQACMDAGLVISHRTVNKLSTSVMFNLAPEIQEFLNDYTDADVRAIMDKEAGAMLCAPDDWSTLADGGYLTARRKLHSPLMSMARIRNSERQHIRDEFTAEKMPAVFNAGNYLQSQKFMLHMPTVNTIRRIWDIGGGVLGVPTKKAPTKPVCPLPPEWDKSTGTPEELVLFSRWKRKAVEFYTELGTWKGHVREVAGHIKVGAVHAEHPIWFPVYMDTRGRWYYRGTPNPQGSDLAKSALHFADKKPLGVRGLFWLKVHIANSFGFDKERFIDRAAWTDKHWADIERALDDPENHLDVWGTDAPWCMYSAAWELREAYRSGNPQGYCTGIVVHMDATCSGLQHFSALLRDPIGGQYVNLSDDMQCGPKQDIYSRVSTMALQAMQRDTESAEVAVRNMAMWWLSVGIPRGMAKKPVMTYVYGATLRGTCDFVRVYVEDELGLSWPEEQASYKYSQYCAMKLFDGIARTVPAAEYAMNWLRSIAKAQPRGVRMEWRTPTGFLVQHDYQDYDEKRVDIRSCGISKAIVKTRNDSTKPIRMQNAIAPNFVHSLDAAHITMTALKMKEVRLSMVGIHDSFGTHPCDVDTLHVLTRAAFIELYKDRNILGEFLWDVHGAGEVPMRGELDVECVRDSEFFFS